MTPKKLEKFLTQNGVDPDVVRETIKGFHSSESRMQECRQREQEQSLWAEQLQQNLRKHRAEVARFLTETRPRRKRITRDGDYECYDINFGNASDSFFQDWAGSWEEDWNKSVARLVVEAVFHEGRTWQNSITFDSQFLRQESQMDKAIEVLRSEMPDLFEKACRRTMKCVAAANLSECMRNMNPELLTTMSRDKFMETVSQAYDRALIRQVQKS